MAEITLDRAAGLDNTTDDPTRRAPLILGDNDYASITEKVCAIVESPRSLDAAYAALLQAEERDPRRIDVLVSLARTAADLGRTEDAAAWYRRALEVEPSHPDLAAEAADHGVGPAG